MSDALTRVLQENNQVGDIGACALGEGLKVNSSLQELHLVRLFFGHVFFWADLGRRGECVGCTHACAAGE